MEGASQQSSTATARHFLELGARDSVSDITPMKLIKLTYLAHGWVLGLEDSPLFWQPIEAWRYGPVISNLYHAVKHFEDSPIPSSESARFPELKATPSILAIIDAVWDGYKAFNGIQLSSMTHQPGTPWYKTWYDLGGSERKCAVIDNMLIRDYFRELSEKK